MPIPSIQPGPYTGNPGPIIDPANPNVAGVVGSISQNGILTSYDLDPGYMIADVFNRHDRTGIHDFRIFLKLLGWSRGVAAPTTGHYERSLTNTLIQIGAVVTAPGGAGQSGVYSIANASMYNTTMQTSGVAAWSSDVQVNDILLFENGVRAIVVSKDVTTAPANHRLTLRPLLAASTLVGNITLNKGYAVITNAWGEGTGAGRGRWPRIAKYTNEFQTVKSAYGSTGSGAATRLFQSIERNTDGFQVGVLSAEAYREFERSVSGALFLGGKSDNVTVLSDHAGVDVKVGTTEGFDDFMRFYAHTQTYNPAAWAISDLDAVGKIFQNEMVGSDKILSLTGYDHYQSLENGLFSTLNVNTEPFTMKDVMAPSLSENQYLAQISNDDFSLWLGFKAIRKGLYNYGYKRFSILDDPTMAGAYGYSQRAYYVPMGEVVDHNSGAPRPPMGYEYRQNGAYSRESILSVYGGAGGAQAAGVTPTGPIDGYNGVFLSEVAYHGTCGNRMVRVIPA